MTNSFDKKIWYVFFALVLASLLTPFWVFSQLLFPFITSKALYFRFMVEAALPFYIYLMLVSPKLRPKIKQPLNLAVLIFVLINIVTSFSGVNVDRSLWGTFERMGGVWYLLHLGLLFFYVQAIGQAGGKYLKIFLQSFIGVAVAVSFNGLLGKIGIVTFFPDPSLPARVSSTFGNPIFFASFLIIPLFLAVYFAVQEERRGMKIIYWIAAALQLLGIYFSGTRGAVVGLILGLFAALVVYVILTKKSKFRQYSLVILGVLLIVAGGLYFNQKKLSPSSTLYRIVHLRDSNTEARLIQWRMALQGVKKHLLLGVGPENYYVVFDEFYNPEMYKYDPSWFDKPHNYQLEILVTNGILGLLAYIAMFVFSLYALWKAYKANLLGLLEGCVLFAGVVAYQVQNLTVFDTVSASVAFYAFMGFAAFLWYESYAPSKQETQNKLSAGPAPKVIFAVLCLLLIFVEYVSNFASYQASKRVNLGYFYTSYDPKTAGNYFTKALEVKYNLDKRDTANYYSDFTARLVNNADAKVNDKFKLEHMQKARENQKAIAEKVQNDPLLWMRLAIGEMNLALLQGQNFDPAKEAISKAVNLAPNRVELLQLWVQCYGLLKDWKNLVIVAEKIVELNPGTPDLRWQLAMGYFLNGQLEEAVLAGDVAVAQGFKFNQLQQFAWYIQYYEAKKDWQKVIPLLEQAVTLESNEIGLYIDLAKAYAKIGDKEHAILLARQVQQSDPSQRAAMEEFINSLK